LWHTLLSLAFVLSPTHLWLWAVESLGVNLQVKPLRYTISIGIQWLFLLFLAIGLHIRSCDLRTLLGRTWTKFLYFREDLVTALLFSISTMVVGVSLFILVGSPALEHRPSTILPRSFLDLMAWIPLAISTGIVEELIFRGYFLQQAVAYTRRMDAAVCIQAVLFSLSHGYDQTLVGFFQKLILGLLFGFLTKYKGLIPAMISHSIFDLTAGIASFL
jgi:membrane protease YdiL (CAAX protease family)